MSTPTQPPAGLSSCLPTRVKALLVTSLDGADDWIVEALAGDNATEIELHKVVGGAAAIERLRDEAFDAVLASHRPPELDAFTFAEGLRGGGGAEPVVVFGKLLPHSKSETGFSCD